MFSAYLKLFTQSSISKKKYSFAPPPPAAPSCSGCHPGRQATSQTAINPFVSMKPLQHILGTGVPSCKKPGLHMSRQQTWQFSREELTHPLKKRQEELEKLKLFFSLPLWTSVLKEGGQLGLKLLRVLSASYCFEILTTQSGHWR